MKSDDDLILAVGVAVEVQANEGQGNVEECIGVVGVVQAKDERDVAGWSVV